MTWRLKKESIDIDGQAVVCHELTAGQAEALWQELADGESAGNMIPAFRRLVMEACSTPDGSPVFLADELALAPVRIVVILGEKVLELSEIGTSAEGSRGN